MKAWSTPSPAGGYGGHCRYRAIEHPSECHMTSFRVSHDLHFTIDLDRSLSFRENSSVPGSFLNSLHCVPFPHYGHGNPVFLVALLMSCERREFWIPRICDISIWIIATDGKTACGSGKILDIFRKSCLTFQAGKSQDWVEKNEKL